MSIGEINSHFHVANFVTLLGRAIISSILVTVSFKSCDDARGCFLRLWFYITSSTFISLNYIEQKPTSSATCHLIQPDQRLTPMYSEMLECLVFRWLSSTNCFYLFGYIPSGKHFFTFSWQCREQYTSPVSRCYRLEAAGHNWGAICAQCILNIYLVRILRAFLKAQNHMKYVEE